MYRGCLVVCVTMIAVTGVAGGMAQSDTVKGVSAFHRSGQTFIIWSEVPGGKDITYNVYRSGKPITSERLADTQRIAAKIPAGSSVDVFANMGHSPLRIDLMKDPAGHDWYGSVQQRDPSEALHQGYVVHTLGKPLDLGTGICAHTVEGPGSSYYAVTSVDASGKEDTRIIPGGNALSEPVQESVDTPEPILERTIHSEDGDAVRSYVHWSDRTMCWQDGLPLKFQVGIGSGVKQSSPSPLLLLLHSAGGFETLPMPIGGEFITLEPDNYTPGFPLLFDWWYGYNQNLCSGGDLTKGLDVNYTERRLLYLLDWVQSRYNIDPNRVYVAGGSMGGTGAICFGLRHPEIFSAIAATVPQIDPHHSWKPHHDAFDRMWGSPEQAIRTNEGIDVWERLNMLDYVRAHPDDLPFLKMVNARDDPAMLWEQIPPFARALNDGRHGFIVAWGMGGHGIPYDKRPMAYRRFDIFRLTRNMSFPAFSGSSLNDDPGSGETNDGVPTGQMGGGFDWTILADTPREWQVEVKVVDDANSEAVTDITPRRLQQFRPKAGLKYRYVNTDSTDRTIQQGEVVADKLGLVTLQRMKVSSLGNRITISRM